MSKLRELEKRFRDEPENLGLRVALAGAYREANRLSDAVELYRSVAMAYRDQGRMQQALAVCKSVLELAPNDAASRALLAVLTPTPLPPAREPIREVAVVDVDIEVGTLVAAPVISDIPVVKVPPRAPPRAPPRDSAAPKRQSSFDETPLPRAVPYHVHDPSSAILKLSDADILTDERPPPISDGDDTQPGTELPRRSSTGIPRRSHTPSVAGIASAARRISASLVGSTGDRDVDVAAELDTRQRPRIESAELERLSRPPPTVPYERPDLDEPDDDAQTPVPGLEHREEDQTQPREMPSPPRSPTFSVLTSQFFAPLPAERRAAVLQRFQRKMVQDGTPVIHQGDVGNPLILVAKGRLDVRAERPGGQLLQIGTIATGEYVGEVALLHRVPAIANVIAAGNVELLLLPPRDFYELAGAFPALWAELKDVAERRQREYEYRLRIGR